MFSPPPLGSRAGPPEFVRSLAGLELVGKPNCRVNIEETSRVVELLHSAPLSLFAPIARVGWVDGWS